MRSGFLAVLKDLTEKEIDLGNSITIFTDGPSSEFKNKYMVRFLNELNTITEKMSAGNILQLPMVKGWLMGLEGVPNQLLERK